MKVDGKKYIYAIVFLVFFAICSILLLTETNKDLEYVLSQQGVICTGIFASFLFFNTKTTGRILNFASVLVMVLFVFNFGQLFIYTFLQNVYSHIRFMNLLTLKESVFGFKMMIMCFGFICLGLLFGSMPSNKNIINKNKSINNEYDWYKVSKKIILYTFPVKVIVDVLCLYVSMTEGGPAARTWLNEFPNVITDYGKISLIGWALLIITLRDDPKKQRIAFCFTEFYILIAMLSGIRSENVAYMLVFAMLYFISKKDKIKFSLIVLYGVAGVFALTFIVAAGEFRSVDDKSISSFINVLNIAITEKNVIFLLLDQLGDTGYTGLCVLNKWLPNFSPFYGESYYKGVFAIIPNIPGLTDLPGQITASSSFMVLMQENHALSDAYVNIGGSLFGEFFFNFGKIGGMIFAFLTGCFLGKISKKTNISIAENNYYGLITYIPIMFAVVYWVRDYFGGIIREAIWGPLFCYFLLKFVLNKSCAAKIDDTKG